MSTAVLEPTVAAAAPAGEIHEHARAAAAAPWLVHDVALAASIATSGDLVATIRFHLRSEERRHVPHDRTDLYADALARVVCATLADNEDVQRLWRMLAQLRKAERAKTLAETRLAALHQRREVIVLEVPPDMADQLAAVEAEQAEARRALAPAVQQIRFLEPEAAKLRAALDALVDREVKTAWPGLHARLEQERAAAQDRLAAAAATALTELAALEQVRQTWRHTCLPTAQRRAAAFLDSGPG